MDLLTKSLREVLIMLGARHKERLGTGIAVGLVILFIYSSLVAAEVLPAVSDIVSFVGSIAGGILIMFIPVWLDPKKRHIGEDLQGILVFMDDLAQRGGLTATQKKIVYIEMLQKQVKYCFPGKPLDLTELTKDAEAAVKEAMNDNRKVLNNGDIKS